MFDKNEPLALPRGSVRAMIALGFTAVTIFLFANGQQVDDALLVINTSYLTWYFARRQNENETEGERPGPVYIPVDPA